MKTMAHITRYSQTRSGRRVIFMPLQRMQMMVVTTFNAVPMDPMPLRQKGERPVIGSCDPARMRFEVRGA